MTFEGGKRRRLVACAGEGRGFTSARRALIAITAAAAIACAGSGASAAPGAVPGHGRAWELVTPSDPVGAVLFMAVAMSPAADRIAYTTVGPLPGAPAGNILMTALAVRGESGWSTTPLAYPYEDETSAGVSDGPVFKPDLSASLWLSSHPLASGAPPGGDWAIYRPDAGGFPVPIANLGSDPSRPEFVRASEDLTRVVFTTAEHLLPGDAGREAGRSIYEVSGEGLSIVDADATGETMSTCGSEISDANFVSGENSVSRSAERVFFTPCGSGRVYLRELGSLPVEISTSECTRQDCGPVEGVAFAGATSTGSAAFLITSQQLTNEDVDPNSDLYRYDTASGTLDLLSGDQDAGGNVVEKLASADDGSWAYFTADGRLIPGSGSESDRNLYRVDGTGLHFVTRLSASDFSELEVDRDGGVALFTSSLALGGGDADDRLDVYRYEVGTGITRLSVGNGPEDARIKGTMANSAKVFTWLPRPAVHALSRDGQRAFFTTPEPLVPEDANEEMDVYEWAAGVTQLVSEGRPGGKAEFAAASQDGGTAFFMTAASLTASDRDGGEHDLYAARLGGGFDESGTPPSEACGQQSCVESGSRIARPALPSLRPPRPKRHGRLHLGRPADAIADELVRAGRGAIEAFAPAPGRLSLRAWAGQGEHRWAVGRGVSGAIRPGRVTIELRASSTARRRLARGEVLRVRLVLRQGGSIATRTAVLEASPR